MKKLALLLALCMTVTMLPGIGYTEDGVIDNGIEIQIDDLFPEGDMGVDTPPDGEMDTLVIEGDLVLDLDELADLQAGSDDISGEIQIGDDETGQAEPTDAGPKKPAVNPQTGSTPHVDPEGPQLAANTLTLGVGEVFDLNAAMPEPKGGAIRFSSSDPAVAKVSDAGTVTAMAVGFACVTATAEDGKYSECFVDVKKAPDKVSFNVKSLSIGKGESYDRLKVTVGSAEGEYAGAYTIKSSNSAVVAVRKNGVLKGVKTGKANITVKTYNGVSASLKVTVKKAPGKVSLSVDKGTLGVGEKGKVSYQLPKDTAGTVAFSSKDPAVVRVDAVSGEIEGVAVGKTRVYGTAFNGKKGYVTVKVAPAPTELSFESDAIKLGVGMELLTSASIDEGAAGAITYSMKDAKVATYKKGCLKGVGKGNTVLTAKTYNGLSAECAIEVVAAPKKVKLPYTELDMGVGQRVKLQPDVGDSASTFTYTTSNKTIVKVSADGTITGVKKGSATITVKTYNGKKCKLKVNVVKAPSSVELSPERLELNVGESAELRWSFPKGTAAGVSFESSDPAVAQVDPETGVVTGIGAGEAVVTVTTTNGKTDQTAVTVLSPVEWVAFTEERVEIGVKQDHQLTVEMNPGASTPLKFKSANKAVATVNSKGVVKGVGEGETTITVSTNVKGVTAKTTVKVLPAPDSVSFGTDEMTLNVGDSVVLMPMITEGSATHLTYSSSDSSVADVQEDGTLTAVARGTAAITVTTSNDKQASLKVIVEDPLYPESARLTNAPSSMKAGESLQLEWKATPDSAILDPKWETSNADIAYVDEAGVLYAVGAGYATIKATSQRNPEIVLTFQVSVETDDVVLAIPERITSNSGISNNLKMIDDLRVCAIRQIDALKADGKITSADASKRKRIINNAFADYSFPWKTLKKQPYWKKENSEGGVKDFKPGQVYYGVPYTSGSGSYREYNVEKLLDEGYYYDSGKGYYILDQSMISGRKYMGNDCSCFVDAAIWGTNSSHSDDRTKEIAKSSTYKTIKSYDNLRTGDLICKGGHHVVMFLYFVNAEKTKIMIIENGGIEPGTNTVHCMLMNVSWYTSRGYKVRRLKSLG